jgi:hypothetical protein
VIFVNADSSAVAYHGLAGRFSANEPPTLSLLLAEACRRNGLEVAILDCTAENLNSPKAVEVLKFRDKAWETQFSHEPYLNLIERKFGKQQRINVQDLSKVELKRKLLNLPKWANFSE